MTLSLIAVAVQKDGTLSPHAGRALHWDIYAVEDGNGEPARVWSLELTESGCLHEWHVRGDGNRHPLHSVDVALAGSGGEGVVRRLAERQTVLVSTAESDPLLAVKGYIAGNLRNGLPHDESTCLNPEHHSQRHAEA